MFKFSVALRPEDYLGRGAQDVHLDFHTASEQPFVRPLDLFLTQNCLQRGLLSYMNTYLAPQWQLSIALLSASQQSHCALLARDSEGEVLYEDRDPRKWGSGKLHVNATITVTIRMNSHLSWTAMRATMLH